MTHGQFEVKEDDYYKEKYDEIIKLWDNEQLSAFRISERTGLPPSTIYAIISRLRGRGLIGGHALGRPRTKPINLSRTIWDAANNQPFRRDYDFTPIEEAAKKRGITHSKLIRRIVLECLRCPTLIDAILDDQEEVEAISRTHKEAV